MESRSDLLNCTSASTRDFKYRLHIAYPSEARGLASFAPSRHRKRPVGRYQGPVEVESQPQMLREIPRTSISQTSLAHDFNNVLGQSYWLESLCAEVYEKEYKAALQRQPAARVKLTEDRWQRLLKLHLDLLEEYRELYSFARDPRAPSLPQETVEELSLLRRMWGCGVAPFLHLLTMGRPASDEFFLSFVNHTYALIAWLHASAPPILDEIWVEKLGYLAQGRMVLAQKHGDAKDVEIWSNVAKSWYTMTVDKYPQTGRSYFDLGRAALPQTIQQLAYYLESQVCLDPFYGAQNHISDIFKNGMIGPRSRSHIYITEAAFVEIHANLFQQRQPVDQVQGLINEFCVNLLAEYVNRTGEAFYQKGVALALVNIAAVFEYGALSDNQLSKSLFRLHFLQVWGRKTNPMYIDHKQTVTPLASLDQEVAQDLRATQVASVMITLGSRISFATLCEVLQRPRSKNVLPIIHVMFCFIWGVASIEELLNWVEQDIPWSDICSFLNVLTESTKVTAEMCVETFPRLGQPLPEDFAMRGHLFALWYFPVDWFEGAPTNLEERLLEVPSVAAIRQQRVLWLGLSIASVSTPYSITHAVNYSLQLEPELTFSRGNAGSSAIRPQKVSNSSCWKRQTSTRSEYKLPIF